MCLFHRHWKKYENIVMGMTFGTKEGSLSDMSIGPIAKIYYQRVSLKKRMELSEEKILSYHSRVTSTPILLYLTGKFGY